MGISCKMLQTHWMMDEAGCRWRNECLQFLIHKCQDVPSFMLQHVQGDRSTPPCRTSDGCWRRKPTPIAGWGEARNSRNPVSDIFRPSDAAWSTCLKKAALHRIDVRHKILFVIVSEGWDSSAPFEMKDHVCWSKPHWSVLRCSSYLIWKVWKQYQCPQAARYKLGSTTFDGTPLTLVVKLNRPNCLDVLQLLLEDWDGLDRWILRSLASTSQRANELVFTFYILFTCFVLSCSVTCHNDFTFLIPFYTHLYPFIPLWL